MADWQVPSKRWLAALSVGFLGAPAAWAVPTLTVAAMPQPALVGSTVSVGVSINDIAGLYAWQFNLSFDPAVLQFASAIEGSFLSSAGGTFFDGGTVDNVAGTISFAVDTLIGPVPGASGSGLVSSFVFNVAAAGTSPITFSNVLFIDSQLLTIGVQSVDGSVMAAAVPEPTSAVLMGLGLALGVAGLALRRQRAASHAA
ncbi:MAG: cohesin domain-containing protein [Pseudomonadota bacterium]|nr:cohesin domain-containing protein [Pseudomonadota bacterium]